MGSGWSDLVRVPFFSFLPNFFLGVVLLYVLKWTGVIKKWSQLFAPIYGMSSGWAIPSWLVAAFILVVIFGLGLVVSSVGDFFTISPLRIEKSAENYRKHVYFYDYSRPPKSREDYPITLRYTPFRKDVIHIGILWHVFNEERPTSEMSEKAFSINAPINSGLFLLALMYAVLEISKLIKDNRYRAAIILVDALVAILIATMVVCYFGCRGCRKLKSDLTQENTGNEITSNGILSKSYSDIKITGLKGLLFYLLVCPIIGWLVAILGLGWLIALSLRSSSWEPALRISFALALAVKFYVDAVFSRIHANALDYTNYWKVIKGEEARKKQEGEN